MINHKIVVPKHVLLILTLAIFLTGMRIVMFGSLAFIYIFWNIFLAFIAFVISSTIVLYKEEGKLTKPLFIISMIFWLLFLPNTFYLITDLIHIGSRSAPILYDVFMLFSVGLAGLVLGVYSMSHIEKILIVKYSKHQASILMAVFIFLASFGMYLGRFMRFNSWDIFSAPLLLLKNVFNILIQPFDNIGAYGYTVLFFLFIYTSYYSWKYLNIK